MSALSASVIPSSAQAGLRELPHIDIGGEGRYADAINVNPYHLTTTTGAPGRPIPNLVMAVGEALPFRDATMGQVTLENAPIRDATAGEIARVLSPGGSVRLSHPVDYGDAAHLRVLEALQPSSVHQAIEGANLITTAVR